MQEPQGHTAWKLAQRPQNPERHSGTQGHQIKLSQMVASVLPWFPGQFLEAHAAFGFHCVACAGAERRMGSFPLRDT